MNPAYFVSLCEWMNKWQRHTVLFTNVITYTEARARDAYRDCVPILHNRS